MGKICSFFGHRQIMNAEELRKMVIFSGERLIVEKGYAICLFGGLGEFDELCYNIVSQLKEKYPKLKRIYFTKMINEYSRVQILTQKP